MAKDKAEGGDGYEFVPPDFDEDAFIHREMVEFKTTVIRSVWAVLAAAVAWVAFVLLKGDDKTVWWAGLAICIAFGLALKPLFQRFSDISMWKRMDWVGTGFMFFLTWLALFTVAVNPPISDISPPQVLVSADPPLQAEGGTVSISFLAADNAGTPEYTFTLLRDGKELPAPPISADAKHAGHYSTVLSNPATTPGRYLVKVTATDGRGHTTAGQGNFTIQSGELLKVTLPAGNNLTADGPAEIFVHVDAKPCTKAPPCLHSVFFRPDTCVVAVCLVPFEYNDGKGGWYATARFQGWRAGPNTGHIVAEFLNHTVGTTMVFGGSLVSRDAYTLNVQPPSEADLHTVTVIPQPVSGNPVSVPGYGFLGTLGAVLAVALLLSRRR